MCVPYGVDEFSHLQPCLLGYHVGEEAVACYVEWYAKEEVSASLVELAGQFAVRDVELEERVAGWEGLFGEQFRVPC